MSTSQGARWQAPIQCESQQYQRSICLKSFFIDRNQAPGKFIILAPKMSTTMESRGTTRRRSRRLSQYSSAVVLGGLFAPCSAFVAYPSTRPKISGIALCMTPSGNATSTLTAEFGDVVSLGNRPASTDTQETVSFGETVPLRRPADYQTSTTVEASPPDAFSRRRNIGVAIAAVAIAIMNYAWQFSHPVTPIQVLASMEQHSVPLATIGRNQKPTVVDFWAPWCENCKLMAPTMQKIEDEYADRVNFVMVNGDKNEAWPAIEKFGVDVIPHIALVSSEGDVETALIGPIPKHILEKDIDALIANSKNENQKQALPYTMLDVFATRPDQRRVQFDP